MPKGVYRDSIGKCDLYSNPYDLRLQSHPALVRQRQNKYMKSQDTLSTAQSRMEKEIFLKIQAKNFQIPTGVLLLVGKLGKFAFLTIMLPPYMFLYGIPNWVLTKVFPKLNTIAAKLMRRITTKVSDVAHKFVDALKTLGRKVTSPILTFIQTKIEKTRELFARVKGAVLEVLGYPYRVINQKVLQPLSKTFQSIQEGLSNAAQVFKDLKEKASSLRQQVRRFFIYLPNNSWDLCVKLYSKMLNKFNPWLQGIKRPFMPALNWIKDLATAVTDFSKKCSELIMQRVKLLLDRIIYRPLQKGRLFAESIRNKANKIIETVTRPIIQWFDPKLEAIKKGWQKTKDRFKDLKEKTREISKAIADHASNAVKTVSKTILTMMHNIVEIIPQPVLSLLAPVISLAISSFNYKKAESVIKAYMKKVREKMHSGLRQAFKWIYRAKVASKKLLKHILNKLKTIPVKLFYLLRKIILFVVTALRGAFLILRLMLAWLKALFRYGMILVSDMTRNLLYSSKL